MEDLTRAEKKFSELNEFFVSKLRSGKFHGTVNDLGYTMQVLIGNFSFNFWVSGGKDYFEPHCGDSRKTNSILLNFTKQDINEIWPYIDRIVKNARREKNHAKIEELKAQLKELEA